METLLHYVWKYRLYDPSILKTTNGISVTVIDPGIHNTDAGPDFFNAKIKIGDKIWAGNVEIHSLASDWNKHGHQKDKAYNSVILHVVGTTNLEEIRQENGQAVPQLILEIYDEIRKNYEYLIHKDSPVGCINRIYEIPYLYIIDWMSALVSERLELKTEALYRLLDKYENNWADVFYITLSRNFGFGINNDAFERLAKSLPLKYIMKHKDSTLQVEALFFGQAGLLEENTEDTYFKTLQKEYRFLRKKFNLIPLESYIFKNLRIRPANFPHVKIAQLAALIYNQESLFSKLLETSCPEELRKLFISNPDTYWSTHYHFGKPSARREKNLGMSSLDIILINTVAPVLFAYGKKNGQPDLMKRAVDLLEIINPEKNSIITLFKKAGIQPQHAADTQALIQLKREYCEKKKCIYCRIGHKLLSKKADI